MVINTKKLELVMAQKGMNLSKLSEASGLSRQSLSTIKCRGTCKPETAAKLAKGLQIEVEELVKEAPQ